MNTSEKLVGQIISPYKRNEVQSVSCKSCGFILSSKSRFARHCQVNGCVMGQGSTSFQRSSSIPPSCKFISTQVIVPSQQCLPTRKRRTSSFGATDISQIAIVNLEPFASRCFSCEKMTTYRCKNCNSAYYCSRECQREHRSVHKLTCVAPSVEHWYRPPKPVIASSPSSSFVPAVAAVGASTAQSLADTFERSVDADCCCICMLEYQRGENAVSSSVPRRLPCAHVFCTLCLIRCSVYGQVKCPTCFCLHDCDSVDELPVAAPGLYEKPTGEDIETASSSVASVPSVVAQDKGIDQASLDSLMDMGFEVSEAKRALQMAYGNVETAVGYLFDPSTMPSRLPEKQTIIGPMLPDPLTKVDGDETVVNGNDQVSLHETQSKDASSDQQLSSDLIQLVDMGFDRTLAQETLKEHNFNVESALAALVGGFDQSEDDGLPELLDSYPGNHQVGDYVEVADHSDESWHGGVVQSIDSSGPLVFVDGFHQAYHWDRIRKCVGEESQEENTDAPSSPRRSSLPSTAMANPMLD